MSSLEETDRLSRQKPREMKHWDGTKKKENVTKPFNDRKPKEEEEEEEEEINGIEGNILMIIIIFKNLLLFRRDCSRD